MTTVQDSASCAKSPTANNKDTRPTITSLFQLHPQASTKDVAAHSYNLSKQAETFIAHLEEMTACTDSLSVRGDHISWMIATLSEITRQQVICSEFVDSALSLPAEVLSPNFSENRVIRAHQAIKDLTDEEVDGLNELSFGANKAAINNKFTTAKIEG